MSQNIYDYLDLVRERPSMCVTSLEDLQSQVWGYRIALRHHEIDEQVPDMGRHFLYYVRDKTGWGLSRGWAHAIAEHVEGLPNQLETFFSFVDSYRQLVPKTIATAILKDKHKPTGKRVLVGFDRLMEKPHKIEVVQYSPEPLHFLRFHYDDRTENHDLLFNRDFTHVTTIDDAKQWLNEEFGFEEKDW